jgi:signal transduction histidine kinase
LSSIPNAQNDAAVASDASVASLRDMGHAVREPLNGARLHLTFARRLLEDEAVASEVREALLVVDREIERAARVLSDQLNGYLAPSRTRISLRHLCARVVQMMTSSAEGIEVLAQDTDHVELDLDLTQIERVLLDLLRSAMESSLRGGGRVLLSARKEGDSAIVEVRHQGGNADLFGHSEALYGPPQDGSLSVALSVLADHGGSLTIDGEPGRTAFHLRLPIASAGHARAVVER